MLADWYKKWFEGARAASTWLAPYAVLFVVVVLAVLAANAFSGPDSYGESAYSTDEDAYDEEVLDSICNVVGLEIRGCIYTYAPDGYGEPLDMGDSSGCDTITSSEEVVNYLHDAKVNPKIKAVLLEVDSLGGMPVAAEEIAAAVNALGKPVVAWIRGSGASAAYWVASAADTVLASVNSDVGGIGVTYSYVDNAEKNAKEGITYNILSAGKYKDLGSSDKPLTPDERTLIERDLAIMRDNFVHAVAENRGLDESAVRALADGSTMLGVMAKENGLVDMLGTWEEVSELLGETIGGKTPEVCWLGV